MVTSDASIGLSVRRKWFLSIFKKWYPDFWGLSFNHFDIHIQKRLYMATLRVSKKFLRAQIKNLLPQSSQECSGESKTYIHHGHISWNEEMHQKKLKKKQKCLPECPFEIIGFICWPKYFHWNRHLKLSKEDYYHLFASSPVGF